MRFDEPLSRGFNVVQPATDRLRAQQVNTAQAAIPVGLDFRDH